MDPFTRLAHELGNPLCAITNYAHSLEGKVAPELRPAIESLQREIARVQRMMDELLDSARPREPGARGTDVNASLRETLRFLGDQGIFRDISIDERLDTGELPVKGTALELEQVFANLLLNAADAMPAGGSLTLSTQRVPRTTLLEIVVADTGHGIERGHEEKIFESFVTTKAPEHGTGLGLAIVRGIVSSMGGLVWAEASSAGGAAFHLILPLHTIGTAHAPR